ncbi:MAG: CAAX prenyl protease-related protein [Planctomycetota bacterium]|nr:MAG: CAAX prenyl protease-related protein [Planctomycetota bacterium]
MSRSAVGRAPRCALPRTPGHRACPRGSVFRGHAVGAVSETPISWGPTTSAFADGSRWGTERVAAGDGETQPERDATRVPAPVWAAYLLPMGLFLAFTWVGGRWPSLYPASYVAKTIVVAALIAALWRHYTPIRWSHLGLGAFVGALVFVQWVGMERLLSYPRPQRLVFDPFAHFEGGPALWGFIAVRWAGASLLVPVMEELFWRDFLWRWTIDPVFTRVPVGQPDVRALLISSVAFGVGVHSEWLTATVTGLIYGALLWRTRSLGACIVAHGVTNALLGGHVLLTRQWVFW